MSTVNDIALIQFDTSIEFSSSVHPACLNHIIEDPSNETDVIVLGFGVYSLESKYTIDYLLFVSNCM